MYYSEQSIQKYCNLLLYNNSLYIIHNGRTWLTENREVTKDLIQKHLERNITIGLYPQIPTGTPYHFTLPSLELIRT